MAFANLIFSKCIPNPSLPNNIPTPKNNNNAGTPNLELAFPANMLKKNNTDKTSNTISICKLIFFILKSFLCPHCLSFYTCCQRPAVCGRPGHFCQLRNFLDKGG